MDMDMDTRYETRRDETRNGIDNSVAYGGFQ